MIDLNKLQQKHLELLEHQETKEISVDDVKEYIEQTRQAGRFISDIRQRKYLRDWSSYWGTFVYNQTGNLPETAILPVDPESTVSVGDGVSGDKHVTYLVSPLNPPSCPLQKPRRTEFFINRRDTLNRIIENLQPGRVITICGPGGIGKSALATEVIWRLAPEDEPPPRFPDGIIFHSFYAAPNAEMALEHIALSFGEEASPNPFAAAQRALDGRRALLLLDGTEDADNLPKVLTVTGECGVLITTRTRKDARDIRYDLHPLLMPEAVQLLQAWGKDRVDNKTVAESICALVGGLPLAIRLVGRYLETADADALEYLKWLKETPLDALAQGENRLENIPLVLEHSLQQVSESARRVLAVVALLALAPFNREVVAAVLPDIKIQQPLGELINHGLLLRNSDNYYEISHALIRTYIRYNYPLTDETVRRLAEYYITFAREQQQHGLEGYAKLAAERTHLIRVMETCKEREKWQAVGDLVWAVEGYLDLQGHWTERQTVLEMGLIAAQKLNERRDEGAFLGNLGDAYCDLGQVEKAIVYYEQALMIAREIGDRQEEGSQLGRLGIAYRTLSQVEKGIEYYEQALTITREIGDRRNEGNWLGNLGDAYRDLGQVEKTIECYEQALAIAREIGDRQYEGHWLGCLGIAYRTLDQVEKAIAYSEQGLRIALEIKDPLGEGFHRKELGLAYKALGQVKKARQYLQESLAIFEHVKSPNADDVRKLLDEFE